MSDKMHYPQTTWTGAEHWWFAFWLNAVSYYARQVGGSSDAERARANAIGFASR